MSNLLRKTVMSLVLLGALGWGDVGCFRIGEAQASQKCYSLSKQGKFLEAARCFRKEARKIPRSTKNPFLLALRGSLMRNSGLAYLKASKQAKRVAVSAYHREKAVSLLRRFVKERLCSGSQHCRQLSVKIQELAKEIQYKRLKIAVPPGKRVRIVIRGYRFKKEYDASKPWRGWVRPGKYSIEYKYEKEEPKKQDITVGVGRNKHKRVYQVELAPPKVLARVRRKKRRKLVKNPVVAKKQPVLKPKEAPKKLAKKDVKKKPKKKVAMNPTPPPPPVKKPSILGPVLLLSMGGAAMAAGGVMLGMGYGGTSGLQNEINALQEQSVGGTQADQIAAAKSGQSASAIRDKFGSLETQATAGWVVASSGAALGVAGMVWFLVQRVNTAKTQNAKPSPGAQILVKARTGNQE